MEYVIICLTAFGASLLTFFSGFGLGTILTPVMIVFFPVQEAIALTGMVHLLNNIFKLALVGKQTDKHIAIKFGCTAIIGSFLGAYLLIYLSQNLFHYEYQCMGKTMEVTFIKLLVAAMMILFALFEIFFDQFFIIALNIEYYFILLFIIIILIPKIIILIILSLIINLI